MQIDLDSPVEWRPVPDMFGYYASTDGRICKGSSILRQSLNKDNYAVVCVRWNGKNIRRLVHRLVLRAFVGLCPVGQETRHLNGCRVDNHLSNLLYGTRAENVADSKRHGTYVPPIGMVKLSAEEVIAIRREHADGAKQKHLAAKYKVSKATICLIVNRKLWRHL